MALKKWNTNFRLEDSIRKNRTTLSYEFRCSRKFSAGMTQKGMCHLLFDQIFRRKLLVNGKQPLEIGNWKFRWNAHRWRRYSIWKGFHPFFPWVVPTGPRDSLKLAKPHENTVSSGKRGLPFQNWSSTSSGKNSVEGTKNCVLHLHSNPLVPFSELGIPDRKSCSIYRHSPPGVNIGMCHPQRVWFLGLFGLKTGIHFAYFGLESGMLFKRSTRAYEPTVIVSIPNE